MKDILISIYIFLSGLVFYLYIFSFLFKEGYFSFLSPLKPFKWLDPIWNTIIGNLDIYYGSIFPAWRLFVGMSNEIFYDLVIECDFYDGEKKIWIGTEDLHFGTFNVKNKFFILSLITHYNSTKDKANKLIVKNVMDYAEKNKKIINQITINCSPFSFKHLEKDRSSTRADNKESQKLIRKQFVWQNKKSPFFSKNNFYELY